MVRFSSLLLVSLFAVYGLSGCHKAAPSLSIPDAGVSGAKNSRGLSEPTVAVPSSHISAESPQADATPASDPDWTPKLKAVDAAQVLGSWQDSFFGSRTLTLNADGSAHMRIIFDLVGSVRYGEQLDFDMKWWLEGAVVKVDIIRGQPTDAAKRLTDDWGTHHIYLLDHVEPELVQMRDPEHTLSHTLRRVR